MSAILCGGEERWHGDLSARRIEALVACAHGSSSDYFCNYNLITTTGPKKFQVDV
jgi:hypothetical protein